MLTKRFLFPPVIANLFYCLFVQDHRCSSGMEAAPTTPPEIAALMQHEVAK